MKTCTSILLLFFFLLITSSNAQNLITNGNFEGTTNPCNYLGNIVTPNNPVTITSDLIQYNPVNMTSTRFTDCTGSTDNLVANCNTSFPSPPPPHSPNN